MTSWDAPFLACSAGCPKMACEQSPAALKWTIVSASVIHLLLLPSCFVISGPLSPYREGLQEPNCLAAIQEVHIFKESVLSFVFIIISREARLGDEHCMADRRQNLAKVLRPQLTCSIPPLVCLFKGVQSLQENGGHGRTKLFSSSGSGGLQLLRGSFLVEINMGTSSCLFCVQASGLSSSPPHSFLDHWEGSRT